MKIFIILVVIAAIVGGYVLMQKSAAEPEAVPLPTTSHSMPMPSVSNTPASSPAAPVAGTHHVDIQSFVYSSVTLTVKKGDKVVFTNHDSSSHTATADNGAFASTTLVTNQSWTLDTANLAVGTYPYHCTFHPSMHGTIVVQ